MTKAGYEAVIGWFNARPAARRLLRAANRAAVAAVYIVYIGLLLTQLLEDPALWTWWGPLAAVPCAAFVAGSLLRRIIDRPRPYEALGFTPLFPKATRGQSLPSRHCFAAAAIAAAAWWYAPGLSVLLAALALFIAAGRVLVGHHYISDVAAGLAFGAAVSVLGMNLFPPVQGTASAFIFIH